MCQLEDTPWVELQRGWSGTIKGLTRAYEKQSHRLPESEREQNAESDSSVEDQNHQSGLEVVTKLTFGASSLSSGKSIYVLKDR